jgi:hypothetical protein
MSPSIEEVKKKYTQTLLAKPGVISVGIGKDPDGIPVIIVGLERPQPETQKKLPKTLEGYPLQIEIIGKIKAL